MRPIAWCGEDLVEHLCMVAVATTVAYRGEWETLSKRLGVDDALLPAAALAHDIGKALDKIQADARRRCERGDSPSFAFHEYVSFTALLSTIDYPLGDRLEDRDPLLVAASAALLHHHGMGRLQLPDESIRVGPEALHLRLGDLTRRDLQRPLDVYRDAVEAYNKVAERLGLARVEGVLADPGEAELSAGMVIARLVRRGLLDVSTALEYPWLASIYPLAGMVSVADSLVAGLARAREPRGYAARVLEEKGVLASVVKALGEARRLCS